MFAFITRLFTKQKNLAEYQERQLAMSGSNNSAGLEEPESPTAIARRARIEYVKIARCCFK
ncbi:MAG: hypothetical protein H6Q72_3053 [Firmicutes bacterium]|nr:hypothetical protein [Bacillota bacterium]